ncbi:hypothetical protein PUNSTDRAFT_47886 [Punctularia strigosozonata HHB-11173 SS5]|uniref:BTB domain-containing protein n=1 Tax=Punctularia strigosozonata (strain HHB-11173) TaxID=741275 RepID=R7S284_PUNST|nr:uncharacterized protein PUNSTDRAFT_47886 [Punctularia strigosozonata HHB-11173 SS5]EIN03892.1 hypothetical protein PUNSTDRAFT_47886 [Punctularia strigosozonata HHB-11173 SS5]
MVADQSEQATSAEIPSTPTSRTAAWPFDDIETDLIIRSSDGVDFHVLRKIMSIASPNIKSRLAVLPSAVGGPQILEIPTDSTTLDQLLRHCYPVDFPSFAHIEQLEPVLGLAMAYEIKLAVSVLTERLRTNLNASTWDALRVYACACRLSLYSEKHLALGMLGSRQAEDLDSPIFDNIAATDYIQLIKYNRKPNTRGRPHSSFYSNKSAADASAVSPSRQTFDDPLADVTLRSSDGVGFRLYKVMLSFSSPFFRAMFSLPQEAAHATGGPSDPPVIDVSERSPTLRDLLPLCYPPSPIDIPLTTNLDRLHDALQAGLKYDMSAAVRVLCTHLVEVCAKPEPAGVYAIARCLELDDIALEAAKLCLRQSLPELEESDQWRRVVAADFCRLQRYHVACGTSAAAVAVSLDGLAPSWYSHGTQSWMDCACRPSSVVWFHRNGAKNWVGWMSSTAQKLRHRPGAASSTTTLDTLWSFVVTESSLKCPSCLPKLPADLPKMQAFCDQMKAEIQRIIDQVRNSLEIHHEG